MEKNKIIKRLKWFSQQKHMRELPIYTDVSRKSQSFKLITVNNEIDVLKHLDVLFTNPSTHLAFRGVNNASFKLFSTIQRRWYWDGLDDVFADVVSYVKYQINKFRDNKFIMENLSQDNDYNILALIQHFGGNSNLVDFSYSPVSAFFFAWDGYSRIYPQDGSLNDYVPLYAINFTNPEINGPIEMNYYGAQAIERMVSQSGIPAEKIDAAEVLDSLASIPYKVLCDGKVVPGGGRANVRMNVPYFNFDKTVQVTNANIAAQNGCFIQAPSSEVSLEDFINEHIPYSHPLLYCFDIHKSLVEHICKKYNVPQNKDVIYPQKKAMVQLYNDVQGLDKHMFKDWAFRGFKKINYNIID